MGDEKSFLCHGSPVDRVIKGFVPSRMDPSRLFPTSFTILPVASFTLLGISYGAIDDDDDDDDSKKNRRERKRRIIRDIALWPA